MKHLGDICKINGAEIEPVDCIIGGSPCQDLSVAGKRAGLDGERSGLFMEQIRIVREMRGSTRRADGNIRPRFMVWENVPGAFSSAKGEDFRIVLEETARVADGNAVIPKPPNGKWTTSGAILGNGWSIAWRVLDAQFWGVPQRRRRIALVADFGGESAPEILFERKSVSRDTTESGAQGERTAGSAESGVRTAGGHHITSTLFAAYGTKWNGNSGADTGDHFVMCGSTESGVDSAIAIATKQIAQSVGFDVANPLCGDDYKEPQAICYRKSARPTCKDGSKTFAMPRSDEYKASDIGSTCAERDYKSAKDIVVSWDGTQTVGTLTKNNANGAQRMPDKDNFNCVIAAVDCRNGVENPIAIDRAAYNQGQNAQYNFEVSDKGIASPLVSKGPSAVMNTNTVRRLTPLECERLQGFPDGWTDIPGASDSARYKALGNSIALPPWAWVCARICAVGAKTLGSLFDGIGGFPLIWERINGKGTARWASEIEPFPIKVTKHHFGGES